MIVVAVAGLIIGVILVYKKRGGAGHGGAARENRTFEHMQDEETF